MVLEGLATRTHNALTSAVEQNHTSWKRDIPGRIVFNRFAAHVQMKPGRLKTLYLKKAQERSPDAFEEIRTIFRDFRDHRQRPY